MNPIDAFSGCIDDLKKKIISVIKPRPLSIDEAQKLSNLEWEGFVISHSSDSDLYKDNPGFFKRDYRRFIDRWYPKLRSYNSHRLPSILLKNHTVNYSYYFAREGVDLEKLRKTEAPTPPLSEKEVKDLKEVTDNAEAEIRKWLWEYKYYREYHRWNIERKFTLKAQIPILKQFEKCGPFNGFLSVSLPVIKNGEKTIEKRKLPSLTQLTIFREELEKELLQLEIKRKSKTPEFLRDLTQAELRDKLDVARDQLEDFTEKYGALNERQAILLQQINEALDDKALLPPLKFTELWRRKYFRSEALEALLTTFGKPTKYFSWVGKLSEAEKYDLGFLSPSRYPTYIRYMLFVAFLGYVVNGELSFGDYDRFIESDYHKLQSIGSILDNRTRNQAIANYLKDKKLLMDDPISVAARTQKLIEIEIAHRNALKTEAQIERLTGEVKDRLEYANLVTTSIEADFIYKLNLFLAKKYGGGSEPSQYLIKRWSAATTQDDRRKILIKLETESKQIADEFKSILDLREQALQLIVDGTSISDALELIVNNNGRVKVNSDQAQDLLIGFRKLLPSKE